MLPVKHLYHTQTPVPNIVAHLVPKYTKATVKAIPNSIPTNITLSNVFI